LTKKITPFISSLECQDAFEFLNETFISVLVFPHFDLEQRIIIKTDVSEYISGCILSSYDNKGTLHPVTYFSKNQLLVECNYTIQNIELLTVFYAFEKWHPFAE
jgi:hypothetical protein